MTTHLQNSLIKLNDMNEQHFKYISVPLNDFITQIKTVADDINRLSSAEYEKKMDKKTFLHQAKTICNAFYFLGKNLEHSSSNLSSISTSEIKLCLNYLVYHAQDITRSIPINYVNKLCFGLSHLTFNKDLLTGKGLSVWDLDNIFILISKCEHDNAELFARTIALNISSWGNLAHNNRLIGSWSSAQINKWLNLFQQNLDTNKEKTGDDNHKHHFMLSKTFSGLKRLISVNKCDTAISTSFNFWLKQWYPYVKEKELKSSMPIIIFLEVFHRVLQNNSPQQERIDHDTIWSFMYAVFSADSPDLLLIKATLPVFEYLSAHDLLSTPFDAEKIRFCLDRLGACSSTSTSNDHYKNCAHELTMMVNKLCQQNPNAIIGWKINDEVITLPSSFSTNPFILSHKGQSYDLEEMAQEDNTSDNDELQNETTSNLGKKTSKKRAYEKNEDVSQPPKSKQKTRDEWYEFFGVGTIKNDSSRVGIAITKSPYTAQHMDILLPNRYQDSQHYRTSKGQNNNNLIIEKSTYLSSLADLQQLFTQITTLFKQHSDTGDLLIPVQFAGLWIGIKIVENPLLAEMTFTLYYDMRAISKEETNIIPFVQRFSSESAAFYPDHITRLNLHTPSPKFRRKFKTEDYSDGATFLIEAIYYDMIERSPNSSFTEDQFRLNHQQLYETLKTKSEITQERDQTLTSENSLNNSDCSQLRL